MARRTKQTSPSASVSASEQEGLLEAEEAGSPDLEAGVRFTSSVFSGSSGDSAIDLAHNQISSETTPLRSFWYILLLTVVIGGLQLSWSAEFSNGTPYLLSLGMSKSLMSLVWIAGPMSGTLGQPVVGMLSDGLRWRCGRRRPFMVLGAVATTVSLLCLSWSRNIISALTGTSDPDVLNKRTIPFAVFWVYALDFSISVIQAAARAFIVDNVPTRQQGDANAWAARMIGLGNIAGFVLGSVDLPHSRGGAWLGHTQFQALSSCAALALLVTVAPACWFITERDPNLDVTVTANTSTTGLTQIWRETAAAMRRLSPQTRLACQTEFFAWIGYFPMLFYSSTYVGTLYKQSAHPGEVTTPELEEEATRRGSQALLVFAVVSLAGNFLLPYLSTSTYSADTVPKHHRIPGRWLRPNLTVSQLWTAGHVVFVLATLSTFFIRTAGQATVFVGVLGIPWSVALWAPFVLVSEEVSRIKHKKESLPLTTTQPRARYKFEGYEHNAGIILGIHNVAVALPQVVSSLFASLLFKILDAATPEGTETGQDSAGSLGWVFRFGGAATLVAVWLSVHLKAGDELDADENQVEPLA